MTEWMVTGRTQSEGGPGSNRGDLDKRPLGKVKKEIKNFKKI
jgi:hypothetical protein